MKVKREKIDSHVERQLATGMVVSAPFLAAVEPLFRPNLVESKAARKVCEWALAYWQKYRRAVGKSVEDLYESLRRDERTDPDMAEIIGDFLTSISSEYERAGKFNHRYVLDQTEELFRARSLKMLSEDIEAHLSQDELVEAEAKVAEFTTLRKEVSTGVNPLTNKEAIYQAFNRESDILFTLPGAAGQMMNEHLCRDGFIGIMGPEKRGKTWMLLELALRAAKARCNVAFFEVGDMSEGQIIRRKHIRIAGRSDHPKYCGRFLVPVVDCANNQDNSCSLAHRECEVGIKDGEDFLGFVDAPRNYRPCSACLTTQDPHPFRGAVWYKEVHIEKPLTWRDALKNGTRLAKWLRGRDFKLVSVPNKSINVKQIKAQLDIWEKMDDFVPDVIIIDYADILAPEDTKKDFRHQQNESWQAMRAMSQDRHCLVITATQADAASYDTPLLSMENFSEDKRKYAHVTGMVGLNQTSDEKRAGIMRLNWLVLREGEFNSQITCTILQSLRMGRPLLDSFW